IARIDAAVKEADPCPPTPFALSLSKGASPNRASTGSARTGSCPSRPGALLFISGSFANGGPTLLSEMMAKAGLGDASKQLGLAFSGTVPVESLVAHPPRLLLEPDPATRAATLRRRVLAKAGD